MPGTDVARENWQNLMRRHRASAPMINIFSEAFDAAVVVHERGSIRWSEIRQNVDCCRPM